MTVWEQLGIKPCRDERAIKRAYAKKLKTIRPDENPREFQSLREARDEAIWLSRFDDLPFDEDGEDALASGPEESAAASQRSDDQSADDPTPADGLVPDSDAPSPASADRSEQKSSDSGTGPEPESESHVDQVESIVADIEKQFGPWNTKWDYDSWWTILSKVAKLDIWQRQNIQYDILEHLGKAVAQSVTEGYSIHDKEHLNAVLLLLDEEFGWSRDDRMLYNAMKDEHADLLSDIIRRLSLINSKVRKTHESVVQSPDDFPILSLSDLQAYFSNRKTSPYLLYYTDSMNFLKWKTPSWHWLPFLFSYMWTAWRGMVSRSLWILLLAITGALSLAVGKTYDSRLLFQLGLACFGMSHIYVGLNAKRWVLEQAEAAIREVDEKRIVEEKERTAALARKGAQRAWPLVLLVLLLWLASKVLIRFI